MTLCAGLVEWPYVDLVLFRPPVGSWHCWLVPLRGWISSHSFSAFLPFSTQPMIVWWHWLCRIESLDSFVSMSAGWSWVFLMHDMQSDLAPFKQCTSPGSGGTGCWCVLVQGCILGTFGNFECTAAIVLKNLAMGHWLGWDHVVGLSLELLD